MPVKKTTAAAAAQHTHADLEKKVAALEKEVAALKKELAKAKGGADPRVSDLINIMKNYHPRWKKTLEQSKL